MGKKDHIGEIYKIPVDGNVHAYARVIRKLTFDIYAFFTVDDIDVKSITDHPVSFTLSLYAGVFKRSSWVLVGTVPLTEEEMNREIVFFRQGLLNLNDCWLVDLSGKETKVSPEQCVGVERLAVWDYDHVQDRLRNIFFNRKDLAVEGMRVKLPLSS